MLDIFDDFICVNLNLRKYKKCKFCTFVIFMVLSFLQPYCFHRHALNTSEHSSVFTALFE